MKYLSKRLLKKKTNYSSGFRLNSKEVLVMAKNNFECWTCGENLIKQDDFPSVHHGSPYCENCERDQFYSICEICEDWFQNPDWPIENEFIYISKDLESDTEMAMGFYKVLDKPYFYGSILTGFDSFFHNRLELIRSFNYDSFAKEYYSRFYSKKSTSGCVCESCVNTFAYRIYDFEAWVDPKLRIHRNIYKRGLIEKYGN